MLFRVIASYNDEYKIKEKLWEYVKEYFVPQHLGSGKQLPDRIKRLVDIGFVWNPLADAWEKMFAELVEYMQTHGDCNVSARWAENPQLGNWVRVQRERYTARNRNKLQPDRIKRLSDLGFRF